MRNLIAPALLALAATGVHAQHDAKTLAQFDLGFAKCESRFAHMKGHRDEAFLALWKVKPTAERRAALARQRKSPKYQEARAQAQKDMVKETAEVDQKIRSQCEATWGEMQRNRPPVPASAPK